MSCLLMALAAITMGSWVDYADVDKLQVTKDGYNITTLLPRLTS